VYCMCVCWGGWFKYGYRYIASILPFGLSKKLDVLVNLSFVINIGGGELAYSAAVFFPS
jgi:hypothetical protein